MFTPVNSCFRCDLLRRVSGVYIGSLCSVITCGCLRNRELLFRDCTHTEPESVGLSTVNDVRCGPADRVKITTTGSCKQNDSILIGCINACSIRNKTAALTDLLVDQDLDILGITESFHESAEDVALKRITPDGYIALEKAREATLNMTGRSGSPRGVSF